MKKHTHKGNCQLCGKLLAVNSNGGVSKHNYIEGGQLKACYGGSKKPVQQDVAWTNQVIERESSSANDFTKWLAKAKTTLMAKELKNEIKLSKSKIEFLQNLIDSLHGTPLIPRK